VESCKLRYFDSFEFFDHTADLDSRGEHGLNPPVSTMLTQKERSGTMSIQRRYEEGAI